MGLGVGFGVDVGIGVAAAGWAETMELAPALAELEAGAVADPAAVGGADAGWLLITGG